MKTSTRIFSGIIFLCIAGLLTTFHHVEGQNKNGNGNIPDNVTKSIYKISINDQREVLAIKIAGYPGLITLLSECIKSDSAPGLNFNNYQITSVKDLWNKFVYQTNYSDPPVTVSKISLSQNLAYFVLPGIKQEDGLLVSSEDSLFKLKPLLLYWLMKTWYINTISVPPCMIIKDKLKDMVAGKKTLLCDFFAMPSDSATVLIIKLHTYPSYPGSPLIDLASGKLIALFTPVDSNIFIGVQPDLDELKSFSQLNDSVLQALSSAYHSWRYSCASSDPSPEKRILKQDFKLKEVTTWPDKVEHYIIGDHKDTICKMVKDYSLVNVTNSPKSPGTNVRLIPKVIHYAQKTSYLLYPDLLSLQERLVKGQINSKKYNYKYQKTRMKMDKQYPVSVSLLNAMANYTAFVSFTAEPERSERYAALQASEKQLESILMRPSMITAKEQRIWAKNSLDIYAFCNDLKTRISRIMAPVIKENHKNTETLPRLKPMMISIDSIASRFSGIFNLLMNDWVSSCDGNGVSFRFSYGHKDFSYWNFPLGVYRTPVADKNNELISLALNEAYEYLKDFTTADSIQMLVIGHADGLPYRGKVKYREEEFGAPDAISVNVLNVIPGVFPPYMIKPFDMKEELVNKSMADLMAGNQENKGQALAFLRAKQSEVDIVKACPFLRKANRTLCAVAHQEAGGVYRKIEIFIKFKVDFKKLLTENLKK